MIPPFDMGVFCTFMGTSLDTSWIHGVWIAVLQRMRLIVLEDLQADYPSGRMGISQSISCMEMRKW